MLWRKKHMKEIYKMRKANDQDGLYALQILCLYRLKRKLPNNPISTYLSK